MIDDQILSSAKAGNQESISIILEEYTHLITIISRKYFLIGGDQEDLMQEGRLGLYKAIKTYDSSKASSFKTFASRIIEREIISAIRKENATKNQMLNDSVHGLDSEFLHEDNYPEKDLLNIESLGELNQKIKKELSEFENAVLQMFLEGYNCKDIALKLDTNPKSIGNALTRIRSKLICLKEKLWVILLFIENIGHKLLMK